MWPYLISVYGMGIGKQFEAFSYDAPELIWLFSSYHLCHGSYGLRKCLPQIATTWQGSSGLSNRLNANSCTGPQDLVWQGVNAVFANLSTRHGFLASIGGVPLFP